MRCRIWFSLNYQLVVKTIWTIKGKQVFSRTSKIFFILHYRVTHHVRQNLLLTSKQELSFGLAWPGQARPKRNFCFDVNWRFWRTWCVTLYIELLFKLFRLWASFSNLINSKAKPILDTLLGNRSLMKFGLNQNKHIRQATLHEVKSQS